METTKMKVNVWHVTGYKGQNDYDGSDDNNTDIVCPMDSRLTKEMVEEFFCNYYGKKHRVVVLSAKCMETKTIEITAAKH